MTKKHFIALADMIKAVNAQEDNGYINPFTEVQLEALAEFCKSQNPNFNRERWLSYISGS